jgi:hypothetical protein
MAERNPQEKKASELLMKNLDKTYESKLSGKRKAVEKWSNRGESGKAELAKELAALQDVETKEDRKSFDGSYIDMENARKYGRDAYKSRDFGKPKTVGYGGKLKWSKRRKSVPAFAADGVGKMNMGGKMNGMMGYKKGGKIDGIAMKGKTKGRMC